MNGGGGALALRAIAFLLLLLIGWRAWLLADYGAVGRTLDEVEEDHESAARARMSLLDMTADQRMSDNQRSRYESLRTAVSRELLLGSAKLIWPDGGRLDLGTAIQAPLGAPATGDLELVIDGASLGRSIAEVTIDSKPAVGSDHRYVIPLDLDAERPDRRVELSILLEGAPRHDLRLNFLRDLNRPQVEFRSDRREQIPVEDDVVGVAAEEKLRLEILDGTLLRAAEVSVDGNLVSQATNRRGLAIALPAEANPGADRVTRVTISATDWSGNDLERSFEIRPIEPEAPRLVAATLDGRDLLGGPVRFNGGRAEIAFEVEGRSRDGRLLVAIDGEAEARGLDLGRPPLRLSFDLGADRTSITGTLAVLRYGRELELGRFTVEHDATLPSVELEDEGGVDLAGDLPFRKIEIHEAKDFELRIADEALDLTRLKVDRKGGVRTRPPVQTAERVALQVSVQGPGSLEVEAWDLAGNHVGKRFEFALVPRFADDDGKGPTITLLAGGQALDPRTDHFFWQAADDLELRIEDAGGIKRESLDLRGLDAAAALPEDDRAEFRFPVSVTGSPAVEVADRQGNLSAAGWSVQVVNGPATFDLDEARRRVGKLPVAIGWRLQDVVPESALRCRLIGPDGNETTLPTAGRRAEITSAPGVDGSYRLVLELLTPKGPVTIAEDRLEVALKP